MEHQDTKLTSMPPRLKELNDNPYANDCFFSPLALFPLTVITEYRDILYLFK